MIAMAHAVGNPRTVMVHLEHTSAANMAMMRSLALGFPTYSIGEYVRYCEQQYHGDGKVKNVQLLQCLMIGAELARVSTSTETSG